ncbi:hypothetical protein [Frankia sp. Cj3]|uniref:hypothetical protein n=1 Tax=Frankia sp. Cj3 TaxID=2880976 RepID=UPI001EF3FC6E|nr:hypothetical protein [Frankia sp. Cj3]
MANHLTLVSRDGQWKAELHAWKSNWLVYASIGGEATLYHRQETKNTWGQSTVDWVETTGSIFINNIYKGGGRTFNQSVQFQGRSHGELKVWAVGFLKIDINIDTGDVSGSPTTASLIVDSVEAHISGVVGSFEFEGVVSAATAIVQQSTW